MTKKTVIQQNKSLELFKQEPTLLENAFAGLSDIQLDYAPSNDGWTKSAKLRDSNGEIEIVLMGFVIKMQPDHVVHHVERISEIRNEIYGT